MLLSTLSQLSLAGAQVSATPSQVINAAYDTSGNGGRKLVQLSNGWLVAGAYGNNGNIYFYVSKDGGHTWSQLTYYGVSATAGFSMVSRGTVVYVLACYSGSSATNFFTSFDATTVSNTQIINSITPDTNQTSFGSGCSLAIDSNGNLYAAWCSKNSAYPNSFNIRYSKSTDGGNTWATPTQVTTWNTSTGNVTNPCVFLNSSNIPCVIAQTAGIDFGTGGNGNGIDNTITIFKGDSSLGSSTYIASGWSVRTIYTSGSGSYPQSNPCAVVDSTGTIHVVWQGYDATYPNYFNIRYSKSSDGGNTWSAMTYLTTGNSYAQQTPSITVSSNNTVYVYWSGIDPNVSTGYYNLRTITYNGSSWSGITTLTNETSGGITNPQTLYPMPDTTLRYIYQDNQNGQVTYDQSPRNQVPAPPPIAEEKIVLWSADGTYTSGGNSSAGANFISDGSTSLANVTGASVARLHTLNSAWPSTQKFAFEATIWSSSTSGTGYAALWDMTTNAQVIGSQVSCATNTATVVRSGQFTLTPGHVYGVSIWIASPASTVYLSDASLIVFP